MDLLNTIIARLEPATIQEETELLLVKGALLKARVLDSPEAGRVRLQVGPRVIMALMSQYIEPGREIGLRVVETMPRLLLAVEGEDLLRSREDVKTPPPVPGLERESTAVKTDRAEIVARILEPPRGDKVLLRITVPPPALREAGPEYSPKHTPILAQGREISARLAGGPEALGDLKPGREVRFEITETFPRLTLRAVGPANAPARSAPVAGGDAVQAAGQFLTRPAAIPVEAAETAAGFDDVKNLPPKVQARLIELTQAIAMTSPKSEKPDRDFLPRLIEAVGVEPGTGRVRETIVRLWSEMLQAPDTPNPREDPALRAALESACRLYDALDRLVAVNQETLPRDQTLHLAFPLFWPGSEGRGELRLELPPKDGKNSDAKPVRLAFLLFMSRLGKVKAQIELTEKNLTGTIWTENEKAATAVKKALPTLSGPLGRQGFKVKDMAVRIFPADRRTPESLVEDLLPRQRGLVDLKV